MRFLQLTQRRNTGRETLLQNAKAGHFIDTSSLQTLVLTCGDAVVRLVRRDVVDAVVFPRQHQVPVLQQRDPAREAKVGVAPLVDLVGQGHKHRQGEHVAVPGIGGRQGL